MKRPDISVDKQHLLFYGGVGACWFITGLLGLIDDIKGIKYLIVFIDFVTIALLLYIGIGKRERNDEMSMAYFEKACAFGIYVLTCIGMVLISVDIIFSGYISFKVGAPVILGITFMSIGWFYHQLENNGDI